MKKRIFIVGSSRFPRGSAGANYDQYLALSLIEQGWNVIVLGCGVNSEEHNYRGKYLYRGIEYYNRPFFKANDYGFGFSYYLEMISKYKITKSDYFIIRDIASLPLMFFLTKFGTEHMCYVQYENMKKNQFRHWLINPRCWNHILKTNLKYWFIPKAFPISESCEKIEKKYGCKTLRLPIMADPYEYEYKEKTALPKIIKFIYPGAKLTSFEDNLEGVLIAFDQLATQYDDRIELHITGASKEKISHLYKEKLSLNNVDKVLVIHDWIEYAELTELYQSMDYLVLLRHRNSITEANFPSKIPETLSYGIVPICTDVGDYTKNYLTDGLDSFILQGSDSIELVSLIQKILNITEQQYIEMHRAARKTAIDKFYYSKWSKQIDDFIEHN